MTIKDLTEHKAEISKETFDALKAGIDYPNIKTTDFTWGSSTRFHNIMDNSTLVKVEVKDYDIVRYYIVDINS